HKTADSVISSYTPSFSALLAAQAQRTARPSAENTPRILVVSQPNTPGQTSLPFTITEAVRVCDRFPQCTTRLEDTHATVDAVINAMTEHDWVHLACHGEHDPHNPTESAFHLHDGRLALSRLMSMTHVHAELAVLSACQTAKGSDELPEEAIHLSAGMLAAGYRSVVATLWSIADEDGPVLADALYGALKRNIETGKKLDVARALHEATAELRETVGELNFVRWVPFIHFGV
ncbi:CHAT domain-containing protein, partial [Vararia minispora EC-137]